ncbi:MAG TPA: hypothetical protein VM266_12940 [Solirubrobacteraceae bacterium]|nr:hypothetical protein [Solirubrobacteraceae bacterium]
MRRLGLVAAILLAGCGGREEPPAPSTAQVVLPAAAADACRGLAQVETVTVLCPPAGGDGPPPLVRLRHEDLNPDPCTYVMNLETVDPDPEDRRPSHVLLGGTCEPLPLRADATGRWDVDPPASMRLAGSPPLQPGHAPRVVRPHVVARVPVRGNDGLLLRADPFPEGGVNGSHYSLVWNEGGAGYQVSLHYATGDRGRDPRDDQRDALLAFAAGLTPARG